MLKKYFGYDSFRTGQDEIIENILDGRDVLGIMPTGAGKSICYQIPAMMFDGVTIVISPLISLMKDQVDSLNQVGIPATFVNSTLSSFEYEQAIENIYQSVYKVVYVAPERLESEDFVRLLKSIDISMFAIDEAHCVSQWGHDFRPSYREIANVILNLKKRPIVAAFTATATEIVKDDIIDLLHLESPFVLTTGFDRSNLKFSVETVSNKLNFITDFLEKHENCSGIIYCLTRKSVDSLYNSISDLGYSVSKYHAGLSERERSKSQDDFVYDRTSIMVATNAFGMGIDKSNVRFVIHYNMPRDLESYYQEAGRAGRDGEPSECVLLYSRSDIVTNKFLIEHSEGDIESALSETFGDFGDDFGDTSQKQLKSNLFLEGVPKIIPKIKVEYDKLNDIIDYCNTDKCLRKYILEYFGEIPLYDNCGNCGNCLSDIEVTDITIDAQKILSCMKRMRRNFGSNLICDVLKGSNTAKIRDFRFNELSTYGIMSDYSKDTIKDLIYFLITEGYIESLGDKFPVLALSPRANRVLFEGEKVEIKRRIEKIDVSSKKASKSYDEDFDVKLFEILRSLRRDIADRQGVPPFVVFSDATLRQMCVYFPVDTVSMLNISGVGMNKFEKYGALFIETISKYVAENGITPKEFVSNSKKLENANVSIDSYSLEASSSSSNSDTSEESKTKEPTFVTSFNLFKEGLSLHDIASSRNLKVRTVEEHLLKCYELGMDIDLSSLVHFEFEDDIKEAVNALGTARLKPIKEALPEEVSYFDIKYFIIKDFGA